MQLRKMLPVATLAMVPVWAACHTMDKEYTHTDTKASMRKMDEKEMMERWAKVATPGESHKRLEPLVGTFKAHARLRMDPEAPWQESDGVMTNHWILGGRFVQQDFKGEMMGQSFEGLGLMGFDIAKQRYIGTWCDDMGTMMMPIAEGQADASGRVITQICEMDEPITGNHMKMRSVLTIKSSTEHIYETYATGPDGQEYKSMDISYTRN